MGMGEAVGGCGSGCVGIGKPVRGRGCEVVGMSVVVGGCGRGGVGIGEHVRGCGCGGCKYG